MQTSLTDLRSEYLRTLNAFLAAGGEAPLQHAHEVGRRAMIEGLGILGVVSLHKEAVQELGRSDGNGAAEPLIAPRHLALLLEALSPFEMAYRGVIEANTKLQALNKDIARHTTELRQKNAELEAYSYTVSHDLRAPARALKGVSSALLEDYGGQLPEEAHQWTVMIRDSAGRMCQLIDDLLAFSRLGRQSLKLAPVNPAEIVAPLVRELALREAGRNLDIRVGNLPHVLADAGLLRQVYINLLDNALKFTRTRHVSRIEIGARAGRGEPVFFVRDNGIGFDIKCADRIFGVFERLHGQGEYEGTGIGLASARRIVEHHGGRIWADAAPEQGASFYFTLGAGDRSGPPGN